MAKLDEYKQAIVDEYQSTNRNIFVSATAGCLGKDVKVLMFDGSTKLSQEICVGDVLMGPDSCPRNVLKIDSGISNLYEVSPKKGEKWICNDEHIFTVHDQYITRSMRLYNSAKTSDIVDKHIKEILKFQKNNGEIGHLKLVRTGVEFKEETIPIDPYLLGLWLAEGTKHKGNPYFSICKQDSDIIDYLLSYPLPKGIECKIKDDSENCVQVRFVGCGSKNIFREEFKKCIDELGNVFIPQNYLINSVENRLRLLAGLIDGDGYKKSDGCCFSISTKWESLGEGIVYLVRSLGLYPSYKWKRSTIKSRNFEAYYFRIGISGHTEIIPNILSRKKASKRKQIKDVLHTGFSLKPIGKGAWFGFTVDGDNRYLLGDFTITHNSGKTFTLCKLAEMTPPIKSSIFLAFNKSIAEELGQRLPRTVKAQTLHSCALSSLCKAFSLNFSLSDSKNFNLAKEKMEFKGVHPKRIPGIIMKVCRLYDLMRFNLVPDDIEAIIALGERYGEDADEELAKRAIELRMLNKRIADNYFLKGGGGKLPMDFTDMLYYATQYVHREDFKQYNVVMLDECQDISPLQFEVVKMCKTPRGRLIAVGDEKQSIYSFMGSNLDSLQAIKNAPNTVTLPLSMTYRCAQDIVAEACKVFPDGIVAAPGAVKGFVGDGTFKDAQEGDFILCRNNAPLVDAFITLLRQGKKCTILGKEFGDELVSLIDSVEDVWGLEQVLENMISKLQKKGVKSPTKCEAYDKLNEKVNVLLSLYEYFGDLETVRSRIYDIFVENASRGITLSTIHKSKGLEADRIFFLQPELLPSKYATTELALYAEKCLQFVAITRARKSLIYC
mgnify:FL=1|jgi:hypothetical protein